MKRKEELGVLYALCGLNAAILLVVLLTTWHWEALPGILGWLTAIAAVKGGKE